MVVHMEYYSAIKKEQNDAIRSNIDGPRDCHTEWQLRQTITSDNYIRQRQIPYTVYMQNIK